MSDAHTEALRRQAAADNSPEGQARLLRARMRAGERVPMTKAEVEGVQRCDACTTWGCTKCKTAGHVPDPSKTYTPPPTLPLVDRLRLRAYAGDATARALTTVNDVADLASARPCSWEEWEAYTPLAQWARGLLALVPEDAHLVGEVECEDCAGSGDRWPIDHANDYPCLACHGTGRVSWPVSLRHHLAVTVGVAVGRACLPGWSNEHLLTAHDPVSARERAAGWVGSCCHAPGIALDAAALWARCPCAEHKQEAERAHYEAMGALGRGSWLVLVGEEAVSPGALGMRLESAARVQSPGEVRRAASEAVLGWTGE